MKIETVKVIKGNKEVIVNVSDLALWKGNGYKEAFELKAEPEVKKPAPRKKKVVQDGD